MSCGRFRKSTKSRHATDNVFYEKRLDLHQHPSLFSTSRLNQLACGAPTRCLCPKTSVLLADLIRIQNSGAGGQGLAEASKEVADRWKCQYQAEGQKGESQGHYPPHSNCLFAPAPF